MKLSLLLDDVSFFNLLAIHEPNGKHEMQFPHEGFLKISEVLSSKGVKGKLSVTPFPGGINSGEDTPLVSELARFYASLKDRFDLSLEGLTHYEALDMKRAFPEKHEDSVPVVDNLREDEFFDRSSYEEIYRYLCLGFIHAERIFGVLPDSVTSPWGSGENNRKAYESAIFKSLIYFSNKKKFWYFLDIYGNSRVKSKLEPRLRLVEKGQSLYHIPAAVDDYWWSYTGGDLSEKVRRSIRKKALGRLKELSEIGLEYATVLTHWQSLYSNGTFQGLQEFKIFCEEAGMEWVKVSDLLEQS